MAEKATLTGLSSGFWSDPLTARLRSGMRTPFNWAISVVLFTVWVIALRLLFGGWVSTVGDTVAIAVLYFFHFGFLERRPIWIRCTNPKCGKEISTHTPWKCKCGHVNRNVYQFPFIHECESCHVPPKGYRCHHDPCGTRLYFTRDEDKTNLAECATSSPPPPTAKKKRGENPDEILTRRKQEVQIKELDVKSAEYDVQLKDYQRSLEPPKMLGVVEKYRVEVKNKDDETELRAKIDREFADNPEERERRHSLVDQVMRDLL